MAVQVYACEIEEYMQELAEPFFRRGGVADKASGVTFVLKDCLLVLQWGHCPNSSAPNACRWRCA